MQAEGPSIRTPTVRGFVLAARAAGADADALIARYGLPVDVERLPDVSIRVRVLRELADEIATLLDAPFIGVHLTSLVSRGDFGLFEFILRSAATVRHACRLAVRYSALINEEPRISFAESETEGTLEDRIPGEPLCAGAQVNEFTMAVVVRLIREAAQPDWHPRRVWFAHHRDGDRSPLVSFFGTHQIAFGAGSNGLGFELADLDMRVLTADDALRSVLETQAKAAIAQSPTRADVLTRMREHIRANLLDGAPSLESVAAAVGLTERTLQRRLAEADTTWTDLIDDVRATLARLYLADPNRSLGEVAFLVGYSDLTSFMRAFRRWTGTTPGKYRERNLTRA